MIVQWFTSKESTELVALLQLQQGLRMPLVEVWMGLLLGHEQFVLTQEEEGAFYDGGRSSLGMFPWKFRQRVIRLRSYWDWAIAEVGLNRYRGRSEFGPGLGQGVF